MPSYVAPRPPKTYRLFISHAWTYSSGYTRMVGLLNGAPRFTWRNYSAPSSKPVVDPGTVIGKRRLRAELADQIVLSAASWSLPGCMSPTGHGFRRRSRSLRRGASRLSVSDHGVPNGRHPLFRPWPTNSWVGTQPVSSLQFVATTAKDRFSVE